MRLFSLKTALPALLPAAIRWVERTAAEYAAQGDALNETGLALARRVGVSRPEAIRLLLVDEMPRPAHPMLHAAVRAGGFLGRDTTGLTLGHTVLVRRGHDSTRLLSHEFRHVRQYEQAGSIAAFLRLYLDQVARHGYLAAPLEVDARRHEVMR